MSQQYNTIVNSLNQFSENHLSIKRFKCSFFEQMDNFSTSGISFPILYAIPNDVSFEENIDVMSFRVYCVDVLQKDRSNEQTILNETLLILRDLTNWFKQDDYNNLNILNNPRAIPVNNFLTEFTTGWYIDIDVEVEGETNDCSIPFSNNFIITGLTCDIQYIIPFLTCETLLACQGYIDLDNRITLLEQQITGITDNNFYTTGATLINNIAYFNRNDTLSAYTLDLSSFSQDIYVTGITIDNATYYLSLFRNDGVILTANLGILSTDIKVTGGTYDSNTGIVTFTNNTGGTFTVSGFITGFTTPNFAQVLTAGNTTGTNDIVIDSPQVIKTTNGGGQIDLDYANIGMVLISTDNGTASSGYLYAEPNGVGLSVDTDYTTLNLSQGTIGLSTDGTITFVANNNEFYGITGFHSNVVLNNNRLTGLPVATASTDAVRYSQITGFTLFDIYTTGGTYSNGTATFTNNTGGTFSVTGFSTSTSFTGGTVTGDTVFTSNVTASTLTTRLRKRITAVSSSATPALNTDVTDIARLTGLTTNITNASTNLTGTPAHGDLFSYEITDNGVARTITWGASFSNTGTLSLPTTTVISTLLRCLFQYNSITSKWEIVAVV